MCNISSFGAGSSNGTARLMLTRCLFFAQFMLRQEVETDHLFVNVHGELILWGDKSVATKARSRGHKPQARQVGNACAK